VRIGALARRTWIRTTLPISPGAVIRTSITVPGRSRRLRNARLSVTSPRLGVNVRPRRPNGQRRLPRQITRTRLRGDEAPRTSKRAKTVCRRLGWARKTTLPFTLPVCGGGGGGEPATWIPRVWLDAFPTASVAVTDTLYAPGAENAWDAVAPLATPPSPKAQAVEDPLTRSKAVADSANGCPTAAEPGTVTEVMVGGAASKAA
jgi:hypothetical protein